MAAISSLEAPVDDTERLQALQRYGILDTPMEPAYDELADIAGHVCEALHWHGFIGMEREAVDGMAGWIKAPRP